MQVASAQVEGVVRPSLSVAQQLCGEGHTGTWCATLLFFFFCCQNSAVRPGLHCWEEAAHRQSRRCRPGVDSWLVLIMSLTPAARQWHTSAVILVLTSAPRAEGQEIAARSTGKITMRAIRRSCMLVTTRDVKVDKWLHLEARLVCTR